jgi:hypothetical protein
MHQLGVRDPHLEGVLAAALSLQASERSACGVAPLAGDRAGSRSSV